MDPEDTIPNLTRRQVGPLQVLAWLGAVLLVVIIALAGCSPIPKCPDASARLAVANDGRRYLAFTGEDLAKWNEVVRAEARGECRFEQPGEV